MVVQHNMQAMNSNRMLNITQGTLSKTTEKLSSGYRINRAADDAAGLAISEKMRKQIKGLEQASSNAQDGISCVQTAEGALAEVQDMLQRMNELSVQAANGTNSIDDRQNIQDEIDQLVTEIDRVAETSKFNETYLLKGATDGSTDSVTKFQAKTIKEGGMGHLGLYDNAGATATTWASGTTYYSEDISAVEATAPTNTTTALTQDVWTEDGTKYTKGSTLTAAQTSLTFYTKDVSKSVVEVDENEKIQLYNAAGKAVSANAYSKYVNSTNNGFKEDLFTDKEQKNVATFTDVVNVVNDSHAKELELTFHVGSESPADNKIDVKINAMDSTYLGVDVLQASENGIVDETGQSATDAIDVIANALAKVSRQRSTLGAVQNRLEHTINNLDNIAENTTAAESAIRDTDMATEMVKYSNANILAQAGQSMLAQANQGNQGVLSLLG